MGAGRAVGPADRPATSAVRRALLFAALALLVVVPVDVAHGRRRHEEARAELRRELAPYGTALARAVGRRVGLATAIRNFAESRATRRELDAGFAPFAAGVRSGLVGVRALEYVQDGRIVSVHPLEGNAGVLGYDITADPRSEVSSDVARARRTERLTITGPVQLVQGGTGFIARVPLTRRPGFPDLAAVVLDLPPILADAGLASPPPALRLEVLDRQGRWFGGDHRGSAVDPVTLTVPIVDGEFQLLGAPTLGWAHEVAPWRRAVRGVLASFVLAAALVGFAIGDREDRLRREAASRRSALELALQIGAMGSWEADRSGRRLRVTRGGPLGWAADAPDPAAAFERLTACIPPEDRTRLLAAIARALDGEGFVEEVTVTTAEDARRAVLLFGEPTVDADGRRIAHGVVLDVTEQRSLEAQLRQAERLKALGKLAGGVALDFNNLLTAILGYGELARDRARELPPEEAAAMAADLDQVIGTAKRGARVTAQLLAFSRQSPTAPQLADVSALVRDQLPMLGRLTGESIAVVGELAPDLPPVRVDGTQFTQVLLNLVVNARDAMPRGGRITVRTGAMPTSPTASAAGEGPPLGAVFLEVRDEGEGIAPEVVPHIFEPYFTTKPLGRGTGLGLAVVHGAVQAAGATIQVSSRLGEGTRFRIDFPVARREAAA